jgi:hypothetical protein
MLLTAFAVQAEDQKTTPAKSDQKAAEQPQAPPAKAAQNDDPKLLLRQLEDVSRTLHEQEQAAISADPALQAERQAIMDEIHQTIDKIRAFDEKVDDKVVAASPDSKQLVDEKRDLLAKLDALGGGKKGGLGIAHLLKFIGGGVMHDHEKGDRRRKGAGK